ncbi:6-phospho-beta-glucosidase [Solirubrobacter ginsenosidimutans]|uniref:6-phospho-beta-glucosidase n=1 Tax=Solirubrobacter ginsenosidimutans TaxID=490573 RepID=A0A9X3MX53_9ACTN|nr:6-phospho-beta-glucosidase [Solirubrobacter ginsenosidimutans]MDA0162935.1 6-phospho-beta-glucosidase [Solirubrobacter ginsenosidimutans]
MKLTIVGGGGFRVPLVYGALLEKKDRLGLEEVVLHDIDASRLERIGAVLDGLAEEHGERLPFRFTTDLVDAVQDADFVFCAIRVGQLEGRVVDEDVPLGLGVLGQETTGPGGICFALRTIPVMVRLAETMAKHAPNAWLINFTNPAGMVTEAIQQVLGDRAVGICDSPSGLCRRVAAAVGRDPGDLWFDYFGLNHLGWLRGVRDGSGKQLLDGLLEDDARLETFEEGRLFGGEWLRSLAMIPNEYLYYFYYAADTVSAIRSSSAPRGAFLLEQQRAFYAQDGQPGGEALASWRATRHDRERTYMAEARNAAGDESEHEGDANGGYEHEAMAVLEAIALNSRAVLILNTANRSALPFLDERAVVEVPCVVGRAGPVPMAMGQVPSHARALVEMMKDVERTTIDAALLGSRELAVKALSLHPLVPSVNTARAIFDGYRRRLPALQEAFA